VLARLERLGAESVALARGVAVLGAGAEVMLAARLADLDPAPALGTAQLRADAVTRAKFADSAVTTNKVADHSLLAGTSTPASCLQAHGVRRALRDRQDPRAPRRSTVSGPVEIERNLPQPVESRRSAGCAAQLTHRRGLGPAYSDSANERPLPGMDDDEQRRTGCGGPGGCGGADPARLSRHWADPEVPNRVLPPVLPTRVSPGSP
jgi:hypothetical protein